jgi:hypothetical protein
VCDFEDTKITNIDRDNKNNPVYGKENGFGKSLLTHMLPKYLQEPF